jgi:hypothetical protein
LTSATSTSTSPIGSRCLAVLSFLFNKDGGLCIPGSGSQAVQLRAGSWLRLNSLLRHSTYESKTVMVEDLWTRTNGYPNTGTRLTQKTDTTIIIYLYNIKKSYNTNDCRRWGQSRRPRDTALGEVGARSRSNRTRIPSLGTPTAGLRGDSGPRLSKKSPGTVYSGTPVAGFTVSFCTGSGESPAAKKGRGDPGDPGEDGADHQASITWDTRRGEGGASCPARATAADDDGGGGGGIVSRSGGSEDRGAKSLSRRRVGSFSCPTWSARTGAVATLESGLRSDDGTFGGDKIAPGTKLEKGSSSS